MITGYKYEEDPKKRHRKMLKLFLYSIIII